VGFYLTGRGDKENIKYNRKFVMLLSFPNSYLNLIEVPWREKVISFF
jgi:hypothetical protein